MRKLNRICLNVINTAFQCYTLHSDTRLFQSRLFLIIYIFGNTRCAIDIEMFYPSGSDDSEQEEEDDEEEA